MTNKTTRILFIEDDEGFRRIVARHLRAHGYAVEEAESAEVALRAVADGYRPGVVLLDLNLPGRTGWELLRGSQLVAAGSPPVVITSATTVSPKRLAEFHVDGYLPKPFPLEALIATVERLTGASDAASPA